MGANFSGFEIKAHIDLCLNRLATIVSDCRDEQTATEAASVLSDLCMRIIEAGDDASEFPMDDDED
jgi:hypothetical protein